jgi:hypothetical protein
MNTHSKGTALITGVGHQAISYLYADVQAN